MSVDLKGYKRGKMPNKAELLRSLEIWKEIYEGHVVKESDMSDWSQGHCEAILWALGYDTRDTQNIVTQWACEALEAKQVAGEEAMDITQHALLTKEPVQAVCFSAQPVANGAEVPVLEDETLCDGCHHARCICSYLAAQQAAQGDISAMQSLGYTNETITWVKEGGIKPEEFLPDD